MGQPNVIVAETSEEFGFHHLDSMETSLSDAHLQLCDPLENDRPGINFVALRSVRGAAAQRFNPANWIHSSLHPNERGHRAMFRAFQSGEQQAGEPAKRLPISSGAAERRDTAMATWVKDPAKPAQQAVTEAGQCYLLESSKDGCRPQGNDWTAGQIRHMLLTRGIWFLLAAGVASWAFAIGLFALHRRRWSRRGSP